jgi:hypothetical protein
MPNQKSGKLLQGPGRHDTTRDTGRTSDSGEELPESKHDVDKRKPRSSKDEPYVASTPNPTAPPNPTALFPRYSEQQQRLPPIVHDFLAKVPRYDFISCMNYIQGHLEGLLKPHHPPLYLEEAVNALARKDRDTAFNWIEKAVIIKDVSNPKMKTSRDRFIYFEKLEKKDSVATERFEKLLKAEYGRCLATASTKSARKESFSSETEPLHYTVRKAPGRTIPNVENATQRGPQDGSVPRSQTDEYSTNNRHTRSFIPHVSQEGTGVNPRGSGDLGQYGDVPVETPTRREQQNQPNMSGRHSGTTYGQTRQYQTMQGRTAQYQYGNPKDFWPSTGGPQNSPAPMLPDSGIHSQAFSGQRGPRETFSVNQAGRTQLVQRDTQRRQSFSHESSRHVNATPTHSSLSNRVDTLRINDDVRSTEQKQNRHAAGNSPLSESLPVEPQRLQDPQAPARSRGSTTQDQETPFSIHTSVLGEINHIEIQTSKASADDELDERYKSRKPRQAGQFFVVGRVLSIVTHSDYTADPSKFRASNEKWLTRWNNRWGYIFSHVQRYIVIRQGHGHCWALPINTYEGYATTKSGLSWDDIQAHAIAHSTGDEPALVTGERNLSKKPIAIDCIDNHRLHYASRLNFAKVATIEHNVRAMEIGMIAAESRAHLIAYFKMEYEKEYRDHKSQKERRDQKGQQRS